LGENLEVVVTTGERTGRSPQDRYIYAPEGTLIDWDSNQGLSADRLQQIYLSMLSYLQGRDVYVTDSFVGANPKYRYSVKVISEEALQSLFACHIFIPPTTSEELVGLTERQADFTVLVLPKYHCDQSQFRLNSKAFIILDLERGFILIAGTRYTGEIKKAVFTLVNYFMPKRNVLPMHCSAVIDLQGNTCLFFGLSGTGKTTLSASDGLRLVGDDEHLWTPEGISNLEGGCYAKCLNLSKVSEPQIWSAIRSGAIVENVYLDPESRIINYDDDSITQNTRVAYPIEFIPDCILPSVADIPKTIIFLTADASATMPPCSKLSPAQAEYYFLLGPTSKLSGTEVGVVTPQAVFSSCFGQPFFPLPATVYSSMLREKLQQHPDIQVYLINTGWIGAPFGSGGVRIALEYSRQIVAAVVSGALREVEFETHPIFKFLMPRIIPGIPSGILNPRNVWENPTAYDSAARELAKQFRKNFERFAQNVHPDVLKAQPNC
jgi:phosphoenolpyruvate carboxykinase (ATP)